MNLSHETNIKMAVDDSLLPMTTSLLRTFASHFPGTALELHEVSTSDVLNLVQTGGADLGLMFSSSDFPQQVDLCYIGSLPFNGVVSPTHALVSLDIVNVSDLLPHRQLLNRGIEGQAVAQCPVISSHIWRSNTFNAINSMVKEGLG